jgi:FMN phosphatase YigB (HAD superfamily)
VNTVVFDIGETLVDETGLWTGWAQALGVPAFTLFGVLGGLAAQGRDHREFLSLLGSPEVTAPGWVLTEDDLYADALPCLRTLRDEGWRIVVGGNQPEQLQRLIEGLGLPADVVVSSGGLGVAKPDPRFFHLAAAAAGVSVGECVHVGDRVDNDVVGARAAGMLPVHVRRGPWGILHADDPAVDLQVRSLTELPDLLRPLLRGSDSR